jgi:hypothetical protein
MDRAEKIARALAQAGELHAALLRCRDVLAWLGEAERGQGERFAEGNTFIAIAFANGAQQAYGEAARRLREAIGGGGGA